MRPKLTFEQIESMQWFNGGVKAAAIDYHINGNDYADYDYFVSLFGKEHKDEIKQEMIKQSSIYR